MLGGLPGGFERYEAARNAVAGAPRAALRTALHLHLSPSCAAPLRAQIILKKVPKKGGGYERRTSRNPDHFTKILLITVTEAKNFDKIYSFRWSKVTPENKKLWLSKEFLADYWGPDVHLLMVETAEENVKAAIASGMVPIECIGKEGKTALPFGDLKDAAPNYFALIRERRPLPSPPPPRGPVLR